MFPLYSDDLRLRIILHRYGEEQSVQEIAQNLSVKLVNYEQRLEFVNCSDNMTQFNISELE